MAYTTHVYPVPVLRPEVQSRGVSRAVSLGILGDNCSLPLPDPGGCQHPWPAAISLCPSGPASSDLSLSLFVCQSSLCLAFGTHVIAFRAHGRPRTISHDLAVWEALQCSLLQWAWAADSAKPPRGAPSGKRAKVGGCHQGCCVQTLGLGAQSSLLHLRPPGRTAVGGEGHPRVQRPGFAWAHTQGYMGLRA